MRLIRNLFFFVLFVLCAVFLSINSHTINLQIVPKGLDLPLVVLSLPAYVVVLFFTTLGLLLGTLFEYSRTWRERGVSAKRLREVEKLNAKVKYLTDQKTSETDEILGLLK